MAYANLDIRIETNLQEMSDITTDFNIRFFTPVISVLIDDYNLLVESVKNRKMKAIQLFLWKYGVNAAYSVSR